MRARPLSMTAVTPSTVTELSATFVARMTFRCLAGATARSCSAGGQVAMQRQHQQPGPARDRLALAHGTSYLRRSRQKSQNVSGGFLRDQQFKCIRQLCFQRLWRVGQMADRKIELPPLRSQDRTVLEGIAPRGPASSVADMTTMRSSGRVCCRRFSNASARSLSRWRSWNSSSTTARDPL